MKTTPESASAAAVSLTALHVPAQLAAFVTNGDGGTPATGADGVYANSTAFTDAAFYPENLMVGNATYANQLFPVTNPGNGILCHVTPLFLCTGTPSWANPPAFQAYGEFLVDKRAINNLNTLTGWTTEDLIPTLTNDSGASQNGRLWLPLFKPTDPISINHQFDQTKIFKGPGANTNLAYLPPVSVYTRGARRILIVPTHCGGAAYDTHGTAVTSFVLMAHLSS